MIPKKVSRKLHEMYIALCQRGDDRSYMAIAMSDERKSNDPVSPEEYADQEIRKLAEISGEARQVVNTVVVLGFILVGVDCGPKKSRRGNPTKFDFTKYMGKKRLKAA